MAYSSPKNFYKYSICSTLFAVGAVVFGAQPVSAQEAVVLDEIVVTASRTPLELSKVGSTVHVIDDEELEKHSQYQLKDYLERLPGISFVQNGPPGTTSTIRMRGGSGQYIKVLIDGVDVSDPTSTQAQTNFSSLLVGDIERVEVLKGSQSILYGSEAVAGVISITTKKAKNGALARVGGEYGQYNTRSGNATVGFGNGNGHITVTAQGLNTDGFSAADENNGNTEEDGHKNRTFSANGSVNLSDSASLFFSARSLYSRTEYDDSFPAVADDLIGNYTSTEQRSGRFGANVDFLDGRFKNTVSVEAMELERIFFDSIPGSSDGDRFKADYQGTVELDPRFIAVFGAEHERNSIDTSAGIDKSVTTDSVFAQLLLEPIENLNFTIGGRHSDHETFGSFDSYRFTGAWYFPQTDTKIRGSYGTGFRAPSLYELYAPGFTSFGVFYPVGNADLQPEESKSWDAGIDQTLLDGRVKLSATYFSLDTENLIDFEFGPGYIQIEGVTERRGVELSAGAEIAPWLYMTAAYTYTEAKEENGDRLVRQPRNLWTLGADIRPMDKVLLTVTANIVNDTIDRNDVELDDYVLVNAKLSYVYDDRTTAYLRAENILDQEYQTVNGYGTSDFAVYGGLTYKLTD